MKDEIWKIRKTLCLEWAGNGPCSKTKGHNGPCYFYRP